MTTPGQPSPRIAQAREIVARQLGCDEHEAMRRFRERAESMNYRLHNYALLVIEGMVRFGDD